jgi:hypothetical protein
MQARANEAGAVMRTRPDPRPAATPLSASPKRSSPAISSRPLSSSRSPSSVSAMEWVVR